MLRLPHVSPQPAQAETHELAQVHEIEKRQQQKLNVAQAQADQVARQERAERSQQAKLHKEEQAQELKLLVRWVQHSLNPDLPG